MIPIESVLDRTFDSKVCPLVNECLAIELKPKQCSGFNPGFTGENTTISASLFLFKTSLTRSFFILLLLTRLVLLNDRLLIFLTSDSFLLSLLRLA